MEVVSVQPVVSEVLARCPGLEKLRKLLSGGAAAGATIID